MQFFAKSVGWTSLGSSWRIIRGTAKLRASDIDENNKPQNKGAQPIDGSGKDQSQNTTPHHKNKMGNKPKSAMVKKASTEGKPNGDEKVGGPKNGK